MHYTDARDQAHEALRAVEIVVVFRSLASSAAVTKRARSGAHIEDRLTDQLRPGGSRLCYPMPAVREVLKSRLGWLSQVGVARA